MKKILVLIQNSSLFFSYKQNHAIREDLMNTNIISDSELVFTDDYISENQKIVLPFFKELCAMNHIDTLVFQNMEIASFLLSFFKNTSVKKIKVKKNEIVSYTFCEELIHYKNIDELDCYSIANFTFDFLDNHHIKVTTHSEVFYLSQFMQQNGLQDYSKMYYQKQIKIYQKLSVEDQEDLLTFFKINRYLKIVDFFLFDREDFEFVLENLKNYRLKNVLIRLHVNINASQDILYLKNLNKKYKKNKLVIDLVYSKEYLENNLMKQVCLNTLKLCGFIIVFFIVGSVGYIFVQNYYAMQEVSSIQDEVASIIENGNFVENVETDDGLVIKNPYIASLTSINPDVIGYLKVQNTNVDYPVVTADDNQYYLKKNLYQEDDKNGWIFMDFRNSDKNLNDNTIIYGHNMYYSGVMFGTLHRALNSSWYSNSENLVITFDTMYESMKWQIYSIYTIPKTSDYLQVSFSSDEEKDAYISMTQSRSIHNFDISVTHDDYLLTLSTCTGNNERLVIHAKRISSSDTES